jgi:hypothetical protein
VYDKVPVTQIRSKRRRRHGSALLLSLAQRVGWRGLFYGHSGLAILYSPLLWSMRLTCAWPNILSRSGKIAAIF